MATPTPSTNTPQKHLPAFSSPAPRSVPGMVNFDSPAALGLLAEGGVGMGISMSGMGMSGLGLSASAMGRADEAERNRRTREIVETLKTKPGRVSKKGIMDLCNKEGLGFDEEAPKNGNGVGVLMLLIGNGTLCEIPMRGDEIVHDSINLMVNDDRHDYAKTGTKIVADSLRPLPGTAKINLTLERFAQNLDKLLRMEVLSDPKKGGVSCYQAIFGVYTSLKKLFEHEKRMALSLMEANTPYASRKAEREVLCKKSGRPRINAGSCLGLSLEYWMDRRHLATTPSQQPTSTKGKDKMEVDSTSADDLSEDGDVEINKIYSLTIECESSPSPMYNPIRISDSWISDAVEKAPDAADSDISNILLNRPTLDWLDPPPTYLPSAAPDGDPDAMNLDNASGRLPNIRFIAKFNPPLVVPLSVFVTIQQSLGLDVPNDIRATTFVGLALRPSETEPGFTGVSNDPTQEINVEKTVLALNKDGKEEQRVHANSLYVPRTEWSRTIESLPFSHPRQLVDLLPTLRQYAFTTSLLQHTFGTGERKEKTDMKKPPTSPLSPPPTPDKKAPLQLDLSLSYAPPAPRLRIDIPHPNSTSSTLASSSPSPTDLLSSLLSETPPNPPITVTLDVHPNAELLVAEQNVTKIEKPAVKVEDVDMEDASQDLDERVKRIAKALDVCQDIGVWGEWIRRDVEKRLPVL